MKRKIATILIGTIACLQIAGHLIGSRTLRGLGLATGIAPYPKVFCEANGYEPFAATFELTGSNEEKIALTAERYADLEGPYQRRNVYGAALAYAPGLPEDLRNHLFEKILTDNFTLAHELGLTEIRDPEIIITPREGETPSCYHYPLSST